jgi:hypothetical protein
MLHLPALAHHSWLVAAGAALGFVLSRFVGFRVGASLMAIAAAAAVAIVARVLAAQATGEPA